MIYDRIKFVAKEKGISINKLEKSLQLSTGSISKWNQSTPSVSSIIRVADFLGIDLAILLEETTVDGDRRKSNAKTN